MNGRRWIALGAFSATIAVALGAFGAHGLRDVLTPEQLDNWRTAVRYQMWHALALVGYGLFRASVPGKNFPAVCFLAGSVLFCGSIYALCFEFMPGVMGPLTPLGGVLFMVGWIAFAVSAVRR